MTLENEERPRLEFTTNPLKVVVAQLRFPPIFGLEQPNGVAPVQDALRNDYPIAEDRRQQLNVTLGPTGVTAAPVAWRFTSEDSQWIAAISTDFVSLETPAYERFEPFRDRFMSLAERVAAVLRLRRRDRLGLRYINEIVIPDATTPELLRAYLSPRLMGMAAEPLIAPFVTGSVQQVKLELEGCALVLNHGYGRQGQVGGYVIDIDCFDERAAAFDLASLGASLGTFKRWAWTLFRDSITDALVERLGGRPLLQQETA